MGRMYIVDFMRGVAAIAVLFWHYQHFYYIGTGGGPQWAGRNTQPLYHIFSFFYEHGEKAVPFFWVLSGFVFAKAYSMNKVSGFHYFIHRFSRLYPLHFLTLLVVASLQLAHHQVFGHFNIYPNNHWQEFLAHLTFTSQWWPGPNTSFNAPIWSVSAEIFIYIVFFFLGSFLFRWGIVLPLLLTGFFTHSSFALLQPFASCGKYFFLGTLGYFLTCTLFNKVKSFWFFIILLILAYSVNFRAHGVSDASIPYLFLALIMMAGFLDLHKNWPIFQRAKWIGDSTYGIYLWHVPFQLSILFIFDYFEFDRTFVHYPLFLAFYITSVVSLGYLSFRFFELPWQRKIRKQFLR